MTGQDDPAEAVLGLMSGDRKVAVVTAGDEGCWYCDGGESRHVPAFTVDVVDTTGCGDVFHGVYAAALAEGIELRRAD